MRKAAEGKESVTIDALMIEFDTPIWQSALADDNSCLCKVLRHSAFKNASKSMDEDEIELDYLICFSLLHCRGTL